MPFLRFSRDKRGYEYFALLQPTTRRGKSGSRLLYAFRSPPNVKVGREPFDEATRCALEAQYPELTFDWAKLAVTPLPAVEPERWRERRNAERAAKLATQTESSADTEREDPGEANTSVPLPELGAVEATSSVTPVPEQAPEAGAQSPAQRRRRRRGRRGRTGQAGQEIHEIQEVQGTQEVQGIQAVQEVQGVLEVHEVHEVLVQELLVAEVQELGEAQEAPPAGQEAPLARDEREPH